MNNALRPALIYILVMVTVLLVVAFYFFAKMDASLSAQPVTDEALRDENAALTSQAEQLRARIADFESQISELERSVTDKHATIAELQQKAQMPDEQAQCDTIAPSAESEPSSQSAVSEADLAACTTTLREKEAVLTSLARDTEKLEAANQQLQVANAELRQLRSALTRLQNDNAQLQQASQQQTREQQAAQQQAQSMQQMQAQLTQAKEQVVRLQSRVSQLQAENDELSAESRTSGSLEIVAFEATPNFCDTEFPADSVCLSSIAISATFNFSPNGFVAMIITDPSGNTIGRESIAGRTVNQVSIDLDAQQPALTGEYSVQFKVNDVFNRFSETRRFMVTAS